MSRKKVSHEEPTQEERAARAAEARRLHKLRSNTGTHTIAMHEEDWEAMGEIVLDFKRKGDVITKGEILRLALEALTGRKRVQFTPEVEQYRYTLETFQRKLGVPL